MEVKKSITLTDGQQKAVDTVEAWWKSADQVLLLDGMAGTGKTTITAKFADNCVDLVPAFTAPTNEATRQLELALTDTVGASIRTTYSFLGLTLSRTSYRQQLVQKKLPKDFEKYNCLVLDEASMAGKRDKPDADDLLLDYVLASGIKILAMGDWAQLPPIESASGVSPIFDMGFPTVSLTEVKRHDGAILDFCMAVREQIKLPTRCFPQFDESIIQSLKRNKAGMVDFSLNTFDQLIAGEANIICWTNGRTKYSKIAGVHEYNSLLRGRLFGEDLAAEHFILPTDKILLAKPLMTAFDSDEGGESYTVMHEALTLESISGNSFKQLASTNTRGTVLRTEPFTLMGVNCYKASLELEGNQNVIAYIPTFEGQKVVDSLKTSFRKAAIRAGEVGGAKEAGKAWSVFHDFCGCFAEVKHSMAMSGHRVQGSNIKHAIVDVGNVLQNKQRMVAFKLLYVGSTRAREQLSLIRGV